MPIPVRILGNHGGGRCPGSEWATQASSLYKPIRTRIDLRVRRLWDNLKNLSFFLLLKII